MLQEGGYSLPYLPIATLGVLEGSSAGTRRSTIRTSSSSIRSAKASAPR